MDHLASTMVETNAPASRPASLVERMVRSLLIMTAFALATGLAAQVRIPIAGTDVPLTLQTLAVMVTGLVLAPRLALGAMSMYLALGLWQVFPFATSTGLMGPTGGYLVGFLLSAPVISLLVARQRRGFSRQLISAVVGSTIIFAVGVAWLAVWRGGDWGWAVKTGFLPFVPEAFLKIGLAVGLVQAGQRVSRISTAAASLSR